MTDLVVLRLCELTSYFLQIILPLLPPLCRSLTKSACVPRAAAGIGSVPYKGKTGRFPRATLLDIRRHWQQLVPPAWIIGRYLC